MELRETNWDHFEGDTFALISSSERRIVSKIMKWKEKYPDDIRIRAINDEGASVLAEIPLDLVNIAFKKKQKRSEKQIRASRENIQKWHQKQSENR